MDIKDLKSSISANSNITELISERYNIFSDILNLIGLEQIKQV